MVLSTTGYEVSLYEPLKHADVQQMWMIYLLGAIEAISALV
jgi:hypothetical protein